MTSPALVVLRPGDTVLVSLHEDPDPELAQQMAQELHEAFPGVEFVVMGGVASMLVRGPDEDHDECVT